MKPLVFVIQRLGETVAGGAEAHCRQIARRLARDRPVEVWTTTALDYRTWDNHYPAGASTDGQLRVLRFPVEGTRSPGFDDHTARLLATPSPTEAEQLEWLDAQGPRCPALLEHIRSHAAEARAVFFYTYLYWPTFHGLLAAPQRAVLVPTLHEEPVAGLPLFQKLLAAPQALLFLTPEEQDYALRAFPVAAVPSRLLGAALDLPARASAPAPRRYVLYLGRVDAGKGAAELARHFIRFVEAHGVRFPDLRLRFCGQLLMEPIQHPRIDYLGFKSAEEAARLLGEAAVVAASSPFESLSLVALEAMAAGVPVLANARSEVLRGHCQRSGAGLYYDDAGEFEEALTLLLSDAALRDRMGQAGRRYVEAHYSWEAVLSAVEWAIQQVPEGP